MQLDQLLYQAILEEFGHGILLVTPDHQQVYANTQARNICQNLSPSSPGSPSIPSLVRYACKCLLQTQASSQGKRVVVDHSLSPQQLVTVRITARWLEVPKASAQSPEGPYILVILESSIPPEASVIRAVQPDYGFTPREAEVWSLARAGHTYREVAQRLFISLNTVKKHMKSALAKERSFSELVC